MQKTGGAGGPPAEDRLRRSQLILFGLPDFAVYLAVIPMVLYLPLVYSRDLGLDLADIGLLLMVARISDVITDPLIGWLSDRTKSRWGRRKPWLAAGAPVMMLAAFMLFAPQGPVSNLYLLGWAVVLWFGWTMINIPYYAWGAELSDDYHERTRITGWRQAFGFAGNISVLLIPVIASQLFGFGGVPSESMVIIGGMALVLLPLMVGLMLWKVPERRGLSVPHTPLVKNLRGMLGNGTFLLLFFGFMLMAMGTTMVGTLFMLYATFVMGLGDQAQPILLAYFAVNILGLPFWVWLSHRLGKREAWLAGAVLMLVFTLSYLLIGPDQVVLFILVTAVLGFGGGNFQALSMSMKADVIDIAARRTGENIAGAYMAMWSLGAKATQALAVGISLPLLGWLGFDPRAANGPDEINALRYVYALLPSFLYLVAIVILWRYPVSGARLLRIRAALDRRAARRTIS